MTTLTMWCTHEDTDERIALSILLALTTFKERHPYPVGLASTSAASPIVKHSVMTMMPVKVTLSKTEPIIAFGRVLAASRVSSDLITNVSAPIQSTRVSQLRRHLHMHRAVITDQNGHRCQKSHHGRQASRWPAAVISELQKYYIRGTPWRHRPQYANNSRPAADVKSQ